MFDTNMAKIRLVNKIDQNARAKSLKNCILYRNVKGTFLRNRL